MYKILICQNISEIDEGEGDDDEEDDEEGKVILKKDISIKMYIFSMILLYYIKTVF